MRCCFHEAIPMALGYLRRREVAAEMAGLMAREVRRASGHLPL